MSGPVRVLLASGEPALRDGWRLVLAAQPDLEVVAEARDGVRALAVLRRTPVDVAVVDVDLLRRDGLALAALAAEDARVRLVQRPPVTRVVLMATVDLDRVAADPRAAAADALLWTGAPPERLLAEIRDAAARRAR